jgi:hypothetical protein
VLQLVGPRPISHPGTKKAVLGAFLRVSALHGMQNSRRIDRIVLMRKMGRSRSSRAYGITQRTGNPAAYSTGWKDCRCGRENPKQLRLKTETVTRLDATAIHATDYRYPQIDATVSYPADRAKSYARVEPARDFTTGSARVSDPIQTPPFLRLVANST